MAACNPYGPDYRETCAGMLLPDGPTAHPYQPDGILFGWWALVEPQWPVAGTRLVVPYEDELEQVAFVTADTSVSVGAYYVAAPETTPVPEPAALALTVATMVAMLLAAWRQRCLRRHQTRLD